MSQTLVLQGSSVYTAARASLHEHECFDPGSLESLKAVAGAIADLIGKIEAGAVFHASSIPPEVAAVPTGEPHRIPGNAETGHHLRAYRCPHKAGHLPIQVSNAIPSGSIPANTGSCIAGAYTDVYLFIDDYCHDETV
jgi:hypothetical protein